MSLCKSTIEAIIPWYKSGLFFGVHSTFNSVISYIQTDLVRELAVTIIIILNWFKTKFGVAEH